MPIITTALRSAQAASTSSSNSQNSLAASSSSTAILGPQQLPPLSVIPLNPCTVSKISVPVNKISSEEDVAKWKQSQAYSMYLLFLERVCESCVGKPTRLPPPPSCPSTFVSPCSNSVPTFSTASTPLDKLVALLYQLDSWTDQIEPQSKPQRFGNLAFRDWGGRLTERSQQLHEQLLPKHLHVFIPELKAYLDDAFGSFTRIDYGSGHELCFFAWVCFLYRLNFFHVSSSSEVYSNKADTRKKAGKEQEETNTVADVDVEEAIGLQVFPLYLMVVWRLQDRYALEPAGSHGVWGLDDYHFLPYVIGSSQLRLQSQLRPHQAVLVSSHSSILSDQLGSDRNPSTLIGKRITLPSSLLIPTSSPFNMAVTTEESDDGAVGRGGGKDEEEEEEGKVIVPNLYLTSLLRIQVLKRGPFHEHSPLLHDISTSVPNWVKVYVGMVKMYNAECLSKKVVVQHFGFGGTGYVWDDCTLDVAKKEIIQAGLTKLPAQSMALGAERGNLGSLGVPTARVGGIGIGGTGTGMTRIGTETMFAKIASGDVAARGIRPGQGIGFGPRPDSTTRPMASTSGSVSMMMPPPTSTTTRPSSGIAASGISIPPLRASVRPSSTINNTAKANQDKSS